jgi:hypothetical protein
MIGSLLSSVAILLAAPHGAVPAAVEPSATSDSVPAYEARGETIVALLKAHYVNPADVEQAEAFIRQAAARNASLGDEAFALAVGPELSKLLRDRHLLLEFRARPIRERPQTQAAEPDAAAKAKMEEFARRVNYGLTEVAVLDDNIGYLRIDGFMPPEVAGPALAQAMKTLHGTKGLVIDLRESVNGGDPRMVALVCAYLVPEEGRLLTTIAWRHRPALESRIPALAQTGDTYPSAAPIYVLTSRRTFSAGEELAYNLQALKRARLIGEPTGGGANPGSEYRVSAHLALFIPEGTAINAETGTNWNWTGVIPDEHVDPAAAMERALGLMVSQ